ncbi:MAG: leucyl aminopeptidase [Nitrospirae bacterium]|nr:leucyl aminopeptidase [Nitrospirota bacterium]
MKIGIWSAKVAPKSEALICLFQFEEDKSPAWGLLADRFHGEIQKILGLEQFKGKEGKSVLIHTGGGRILVAGLGKRSAFDLEKWRQAAARAARRSREMKAKELLLIPADHAVLADTENALLALGEAVSLALYRYDRYLKDEEASELAAAYLVTSHRLGRREAELASKAQVLAEAVNAARTLINEPASTMTPEDLARAAQSLTPGVEVMVHDEKWIQRMKMGGVMGVARGSHRPPRFIELRYKPRTKSPKGPIALIGKGITFDSGGLSLKPAKSMETMKSDMSGAAAVIGTFRVLKELKPEVEVRGYIAATENMPGGNAYKPGDVLVTMSGKTIEVNNTDAEGRLTLADVLYHAAQAKPKAMIDLATLTGACVVALGERIAGLFGNDEKLIQGLSASSNRTGDKLWAMPMEDDYKDLLKSDIADMKNAGERYAGSITAALFLKEFVGSVPWAHIDIAGPAFTEKELPYCPKGGTGFGVRLLVDYLLHV